MTRVELPHQGEYNSGRNSTPEDIRSAAAKSRPRIIRNIAHHGVCHGIHNARDKCDKTDQSRIHAEAEIEYDHHSRQCGGLHIINKHTNRISGFMCNRDTVFRGCGVMFWFTHLNLSIIE